MTLKITAFNKLFKVLKIIYEIEEKIRIGRRLNAIVKEAERLILITRVEKS